MYRSRWDVFDVHFESSVIIHHRWMPPFFGRRQSVFCRIKNPALLVLIDLSFYLYALCSGIDVVLLIHVHVGFYLFIYLICRWDQVAAERISRSIEMCQSERLIGSLPLKSFQTG